MPDLLSGFNPQPLDKLEQTIGSQPWEQVDFVDLGKYNTGQIAGRPELTDDQLLGKRIMQEMNTLSPREERDTEPVTFDSRDAVRYSRSDAFPLKGFITGRDNEKIYNEYSSNWENVSNSLIKFFDKTYTSAIGFFRQNFDTAKAITDTQSAQWLNEGNMERIKNDQLMETLYPTFTNPEKRHWHSFIPFTEGSGDFYESFVPQLGFTVGTMIGAVAENVVIDALTGGTAAALEASNSLRKIYTALREFSLLQKGSQTAKQLAKGLTVRGLDIGLHGWSMYNTASSEAAFEAGMAYNEMVDAYTEEFKRRNGRLPTPQELQEFKKTATSESNDVFNANLAILLPSNYIMFRNVLAPSFMRKELIEQGTKGFKFMVNPKTLMLEYKELPRTLGQMWKSADGFMMKTAAVGSEIIAKSKFLTEGFEESAQRFASTYNKIDAERKAFGVPKNSYVEALQDVTSADGMQEFIAGALGGKVFTSSGALMRRFAPSEFKVDESGKAIYKDNIFSRIAGQNKNVVRGLRENRAKQLVKTLNESTIQDVFKPEGMLDLFTRYNSSGKMEKYLQENDVFNIDNVSDFELSNFLYTAQRAGKLDLRIEQLKQLSQMNDDQLAEFFKTEKVDGLNESFKEFYKHIEKRVPTFQKIYEREKSRFGEQLVNLFNDIQDRKGKILSMTEEFKGKYGEDFEEQFHEKYKEYEDLFNEAIKLSLIPEDQRTDVDGIRMAVIRQDLENSDKDEAFKDADKYLEARKEFNQIQKTYIAVEAARKAAIYAADGMNSSKERYEEVLNKISKDFSFSKWKIAEVTNEHNLKIRISALEKEIETLGSKRDSKTGKWKFIPGTIFDRDDRHLVKRKIQQFRRLESLLRQYGNTSLMDPTIAAENILRYLEMEDTFREVVTGDNRKELKEQIKELMKLEILNKENLSMYNFLTLSDTGLMNFIDYYTSTMDKLVEGVMDKLEKQAADKEVSEKLEEVPKEEKTNIEEIEKKHVNGEELTDEEKNKLAEAAAKGDDDARKILNEVDQEEKEEDEKEEKEEGEQGIPYDEYKEKEGVVEPASKPEELPVVVTVSDQESAEEKEISSGVEKELPPQAIRTTGDEIPEEERKKEYPRQANAWTKWTQTFLDELKLGIHDNIEFFFEISRPDMWPADNPASDPNFATKDGPIYAKPRVVIVAKMVVGKDSEGNPIYADRFDDDYRPSPDGKMIVYGLYSSYKTSPSGGRIRDSRFAENASSRIGEAMKMKGINSLPIGNYSISMGAVLDMPIGKEIFLKDLEKLIPSFSIGQSLYISGVDRLKYVTYLEYLFGSIKEDGTTRLERNGSANLLIGDFPLKVYPVRHKNIKINGEEVAGEKMLALLGRAYKNAVEASRVKNYLMEIIPDTLNDINFDVTLKNGVYSVQGQIVERNEYGSVVKVLSNDQNEVKAKIRESFMNIINPNEKGSIDVFYVDEQGSLQMKDNVNYMEFLKENTFIKKKPINVGTEENPEYKLKTVNKHISLSRGITDILGEIGVTEPEVTTPAPTQTPPTQPTSDIEAKKADIERKNTFTRDSLKEISDGSGLAKKGTEILNPEKVSSQLQVGDKITFYAERERTGVWDGKTIKEDKTNNPFGILGVLSDVNGYIKNQSKIDTELAALEEQPSTIISEPVKQAPITREELLNSESATIVYTNKTGETKERTLTNIRPGVNENEITAFDSIHKADRTFVIDRIDEVKSTVAKGSIPQIEIGTYVQYQGETYIVTKKNNNNTWQIYNPNLEGAQAKKSVSEKNLKATPNKGNIVSYKGASYIVTPNKTIISLTSNKKMMWDENNGDRKAILGIAGLEPIGNVQQILGTVEMVKSIGVGSLYTSKLSPDELTLLNEEVSKLKEEFGNENIETTITKDGKFIITRKNKIETAPDDNSTLTQEPLEKKPVGKIEKKTFKRGKGNIEGISDEEGLNMTIGEKDEQSEVSLKELDWFEKRFPGTLRRLSNIVNSNAYGTWKWGTTILYKNAIDGTLYHEGWHHFSQMFLTVQEKTDLYNEARDLVPELQGKSDLEVEEFIAQDFRGYMRGASILPRRQHRNGIFAKIVEFLRWLFEGMPSNTFDKLYRDLRKGNFNRYNPQYSNIMFGKMNSGITDASGKPIFAKNAVQKSERYVKQFMSFGGEYLAMKGAGFSLFKVSDPNKRAKFIEEAKTYIYDNFVELYDQLVDLHNTKVEEGINSSYQETISDIEVILGQEGVFDSAFNYYLRKTSVAPVDKEDKDDMSEENQQGDEQSETADSDQSFEGEIIEEVSTNSDKNIGFENTGNKISLINDASEETKMLIASLSKVETDDRGYPVLEDEKGNTIPRSNLGYPMREGGRIRLYRNSWGLNEPVEFSNLFNNLGIILAGSETFKEMYDRLSDPKIQKIIPEIALLLERMGSYESKNRDRILLNEISPIIKFFKDFQKVDVNIYTSLLFMEENTSSLKAETKRSADKIKKQWQNNFGAYFESTEQANRIRRCLTVNEDTGRTFISSKLNFDLNDDQQRMDFMTLLGMVFSENTKMSEEFGSFGSNFKEDLMKIQEGLNKRIEAGQLITNPIQDLEREYKKGNTVIDIQKKVVINGLAELESKYSTNTPSMSYRNPEGNMLYGLMYPNWLNRSEKRLNKHDNYAKTAADNPIWDIRNNPDVQYSLFLHSMFDFNDRKGGMRRSMFYAGNKSKKVVAELGNYAGKRVIEKDGESKGLVTTSMDRREKMIMDIDNLGSSGTIEIPRTESSASAYFFRLNNYADVVDKGGTNIVFEYNPTKTKNVPFSKMEISSSDNYPNSVKGYFMLQLKAEMNIIQNLYNSTIPDYNKILQKWAFFADMFTGEHEELGNMLMEEMMNDIKEGKDSIEDKKNKVDQLVRDNEVAIKNAINDFLNAKYQQDLNTIKEDIGITSLKEFAKTTYKVDEKTDMSFEQLIRFYSLNTIVLNMEYIKLLEGPIGFHTAYHKRAKGATSTGTFPTTDEFFYKFLVGTFTNTLGFSVGRTSEDVDVRVARTAVFEDIEKRSDFYSQILKDFMDLTGKSIAESEKLLSAYNSMNIADGQGYCTLDFYRKFRISVGNWKDDDETMYKLEVIRFRRDNNSYEEMTDGSKIKASDDQYYKNNWDDVPADQRVSIHWVPIKMQHNGPIVGEKGRGVSAIVMDKFSIAPLIPSVIKNKELDALNKKMLKENIEYAKMKSGTKKYGYKQNKIYADGRFSIDNSKTFDFYEVSSLNLKEQIITQDKVKDEATWGTQMRKLFIANMYSMGIADNPKFDRLLKDYLKLLDDIINTERKKLYRELGLRKVGDRVIISDVKSLINSLKRQAETRDLPANVQDSIMYDPKTKNFYFPLDILTQTSDIRNMISGLLFKKLVSVKINGDMLIQVSSAGFRPSFRNPTEEESKRYGANELSFYKAIRDEKGNITGISPIKVKVALTKDFKYLLNREDVKEYAEKNGLEPLAALNALLRTEWAEKNKKLITLIGYRIPTQGINSMEVMQVQEFLPEEAGSTIILPEEIVAKSGSDFDIDKMTIIRPSITRKGNFMTSEMLDAITQRVQALERQIEKEYQMNFPREEGESIEEYTNRVEEITRDEVKSLRKEHLSEYREIRDSKKRILFNQILGIYSEALLSPEVFEQLVTPNNTNDIIDIAKQMREMFYLPVGTKKIVPEVVGSDITTASTNNRKFNEFLSGKRALGIFALNSTLSQLIQQAGMKIYEEYGENRNSVTAEKGVFVNLPEQVRNKEIETKTPSMVIFKKAGIENQDIKDFEDKMGKSLTEIYRENLKENPTFNEKDLLIKLLESIC